MLTAREHQAVKRQTQRRRNGAAQERRADGMGFRKVPVAVEVINATDAAGAPLLLATSDAPAERGRWFQVHQENGRWTCACGAFRSLGGCAHVGYLQVQEAGQR